MSTISDKDVIHALSCWVLNNPVHNRTWDCENLMTL